MGIYGYERPTTPFLNSIDPQRFTAIAPTNQTRYSVPILLTAATTKDFELFFKSPSLVSAFKACDYETHWISNQGRIGKFETYITSIALEADYQHFINPKDYFAAKEDDAVLSPLKAAIGNSSRRKAIFIHLMGSHFDYSGRYPQHLAVFGEATISDQYDNSIAYTDLVLAKISALFSLKKSLFIFTSDHGELVPEGHGLNPSFQEEFRAPLLVWPNTQQRIRSAAAEAKNKTINLESFASMVKYFSGLEEQPHFSFSSQVFSLRPSNVLTYQDLPFRAPAAFPPSKPMPTAEDDEQPGK